MLGRIALILIQLAAGWFLGPLLARYIPKFGTLDIFVLAVIFAVVVWLVGFIGSVILKDVAQPSPATLTVSMVVALIFAALTLVDPVMSVVNGVIRGVPAAAFPLIGAVLGYMFKR